MKKTNTTLYEKYQNQPICIVLHMGVYQNKIRVIVTALDLDDDSEGLKNVSPVAVSRWRLSPTHWNFDMIIGTAALKCIIGLFKLDTPFVLELPEGSVQQIVPNNDTKRKKTSWNKKRKSNCNEYGLSKKRCVGNK